MDESQESREVASAHERDKVSTAFIAGDETQQVPEDIRERDLSHENERTPVKG